MMKAKVLQGDNRQILKTFPDNHFDSIVTDPPYGIAFLGKDWDSRKASETTSKIAQLHNLPSGMAHTSLADDLEFQYWMRDVFAECLRVLKPGGHLLAFSAARTYHHMAMAAQTAGFEIRDQIMWIYSSGFPKSQDVGRQLHKKQHGKPDKQRFDPSIMIKISGDQYQHPDTGTIYRALPDINGDRLAVSHEGDKYGTVYEEVIEVDNEWSGWGTQLKPAHEPIVLARKPIKTSIRENCLLYGTGAINIDATRIPVEGLDTRGGGGDGWDRVEFGQAEPNKTDGSGYTPNEAGRFPSNVIGEIAEPYQKYFYCPKVGRVERHIGHETPPPMFGDVAGAYGPDGNRMAVGLDARTGNVGNNHPTVKPIELMKYLIKLITPAGGHVMDPFNGSGSTGCAAVELDLIYTGIELDPAYVDIATRRIDAWYHATHPNTFSQLFE